MHQLSAITALEWEQSNQQLKQDIIGLIEHLSMTELQMSGLRESAINQHCSSGMNERDISSNFARTNCLKSDSGNSTRSCMMYVIPPFHNFDLTMRSPQTVLWLLESNR